MNPLFLGRCLRIVPGGALRRADLVTAAGEPLLAHMTRDGAKGSTLVVPMAADAGFVPMEKADCRRRLGLPENRRLIGHAGSLHATRDTGILLDVMRRFHLDRPDCLFVLTGRRLQKVELPENAVHLGYLADDDMPALVNSMDVVISANRSSSFGEHSHPIKLYEAAACGVPFIATSTSASRWMVAGESDCLYRAGDVDDLNRKLRQMIDAPRPPAIDHGDWGSAAASLSEFLSANST